MLEHCWHPVSSLRSRLHRIKLKTPALWHWKRIKCFLVTARRRNLKFCFCLSLSRAGKTRDYHDGIVFKLRLRDRLPWHCKPHVMYQSNRSLNIPPPRAYPGHLTSFPAREGGNLMNLVFPGAGHLIATHRGWGIWSLASISCEIYMK